MDLIKEDYIKSFIKNREEKRAAINNPTIYAQVVSESIKLMANLLQIYTGEVCNDIGISQQTLENELQSVSQRDPNFHHYILMMIEGLKASIPKKANKPEITKDMIKEFFKYQVKVAKETDFNIFGAKGELMMLIVQSYLLDKASIMTGVEEEDLAQNPSIIMEIPEIQQITMEMNNILMSKL